MRKSITHLAFYPWLVMILCSCFLFYKYILQVFPGLITHQLMTEFKINGAALGNLSAYYFYAYFFTQLVVGVLLDKFSTRLLCALAILVSSIGALGFADTNIFWEACFFRSLIGAGTAFATVCYLKNTAIWFKPQHFAFVSGLLATAAMLGAVFGEAPVAMITSQLGWRSTLLGIGGAGIGLTVLFYALVCDQRNHSQEQQDSYAVTLKAIWHVIKNKQNWVLTLYSGLTFTPISVFGGLWGTPFLRAAFHLSTTHAATLVSASFLGLAFGGPILGMISDACNNRKATMLAGNVLSLACIAGVLYLPHLHMLALIALLFLFGFGIGAFMLCFALGKDLNPLYMAATVIALINSGDAIFGSFSEPLIGKIMDISSHGAMLNGVSFFSAHDYRIALSLLVIYLIIASLSVFFMKDPLRHHEKWGRNPF